MFLQTTPRWVKGPLVWPWCFKLNEFLLFLENGCLCPSAGSPVLATFLGECSNLQVFCPLRKGLSALRQNRNWWLVWLESRKSYNRHIAVILNYFYEPSHMTSLFSSLGSLSSDAIFRTFDHLKKKGQSIRNAEYVTHHFFISRQHNTMQVGIIIDHG